MPSSSRGSVRPQSDASSVAVHPAGRFSARPTILPFSAADTGSRTPPLIRHDPPGYADGMLSVIVPPDTVTVQAISSDEATDAAVQSGWNGDDAAPPTIGARLTNAAITIPMVTATR